MQITLHASSYLLGDDHRLALRTSAFYYIQFTSIHPISGQNDQTIKLELAGNQGRKVYSRYHPPQAYASERDV